MSLVEKELTLQNIERANQSPEFAKSREREQKFIATLNQPSEFLFKYKALPIEQIYLSAPEDEFSLRVRCVTTPAGNEYTATLKDTGEVIDGARDRLEVSTPISQEAYEQYSADPSWARLHKLRAEVNEMVTVDFVEGLEYPVYEVEHNDKQAREASVESLQDILNGQLVEQTGNQAFDNESLAYNLSGFEKTTSPESLDAFTERVLSEMVAQYVIGRNQVVVGLTGMSGSGKTTVTRALQERIVELYGEELRPLSISTDDYNEGKTKLEKTYGAPYMEWDDPKTYDTAGLAFDLQQMSKGIPVLKRSFSFKTEEPSFEEKLKPSPFVILEGLYAGSKDLAKVRQLHFKLPTSLATSIGRDVRRLVIENRANRAFPTPESRLRYQIETAAPLYLQQEMPGRQAFSASSRPLAERAFMLGKLRTTAL